MKVTRIGHGSILVEAKGLRILASLKLPGQEGKHLLKQTMEPYLPCEVLYRPKMGLAVPLALLCSRLTHRGYFSRSYLEHLVVQHDSGGGDYSAPVLRVAV